MLLMFDGDPFPGPRRRMKKCSDLCSIFCVIFGFIIIMTLIAIFTIDFTQQVHIVYIEGHEPQHVTNEKFLSVALDSSVIAKGFKHLNLTDKKIIKMIKALSPAFLRVGGTMADRLIFATSRSMHFKHSSGELDGGECSYEGKDCDYLQRPNFTMNKQEWLELNEFAQKTNLDIIFDLNVLRRLDDGSWDYTNAEKLISFSSQHNLDLNWELGNEPNSFPHQFNYALSPTQLAKDFLKLREILRKYPKYANSFLVGPDVTRPQGNNASMSYLEEFLAHAGHVIDAVTWHQYYFNGATAKVTEFINPETFDLLENQINIVKEVVKKEGVDKLIWLGETSSAYGGGAPRLSDRFVATFIWLDKLGLAAKLGLDVVVKQSIFQGHYALINNHYSPTPDWWVSILYKKLVAPKVVKCNVAHSAKVRLYCQCTQPKSYFGNTPSLTVYGVNLNNRIARIRFEGITPVNADDKMENLKVHAYVLSTLERIDSRYIFLNEHLLELTENDDVPTLSPDTIPAYPYVQMPPFSLGFWVVPITSNVASFC